MKLRTNIMPQACFGSPQARFWRGLGGSWACLRRNLDALGELLDSLGCLCAVSWPPFGCFLGALGRIWALIGASVLDFGWSWAPPGWVLANSGAVFATIFEGNALIAAGIPAWHSHWHFVTSLQRGGTCAAHGIKALTSHGHFLNTLGVPCCLTLRYKNPRAASLRLAERHN